MYTITKTIFVLRSGERQVDHTTRQVEDLEKYREELKSRKYKSIHFVYESDDSR